MTTRQKNAENLIQNGFLGIALLSIIILILIIIFLFMEGLPIFETVSFSDFVFGKYWYPTDDPADF
ncbi:MAG: phosphate ABC transporter permease subunit PstC, partial [Desulfamplus sp.]|nr:phosphate ABC transporter permease subunit PstC [Desulfamplus sp.]